MILLPFLYFSQETLHFFRKCGKLINMEHIKIGKYRHFKGNEYEVIAVATHSETGESMVVYRALYGDGGVWVRPAKMWNEEITRDGKTQPRFTYIGEEEC